MRMREQWQFRCTGQWGWNMPLSEHVYCVAVTFKMTEQIEHQICVRFCIKLEHSSTETIWMIQKVAAIGNWWLAASSCQQRPSCIMSSAEIFGKTSNHPGDSMPLHPRFSALWLLAFPKTKITFEKEDIQAFNEIPENSTGHWCQFGELCEVWRCLLWTGLRCHCPMYIVSSTLYLLQ